MKRNLFVAVMLVATAGFAAAQNYSPSTDVLGAHLNYGRGCAACHAPHSGAYGNGAAKTKDTTSGNVALWGEDVASLYGQTINTGGGSYPETLPSAMSTASEAFGLLTCLSCHDGNLAEGAMMQNAVYETLPPTYGTHNTIPTLLGNDNTTTGNYLNDHPVGALATFGCNSVPTGQTYGESGYNWDCTISGTTITAGPNMARFINNYGFFVSLGTSTSTTAPIVVCTTCHNQHSMNVVKVSNTANIAAGSTVKSGLSGAAAGTYQTMFFLRGPYNPTNTASNSAAQFCRQCHGGESNEMNNGSAVTTW
ncbi:MAG TPA: hypothetical protein VME23_09035 [Terracidiphilus sp.]|nr:hypothetical protein [Terracidiphilus sp.]